MNLSRNTLIIFLVISLIVIFTLSYLAFIGKIHFIFVALGYVILSILLRYMMKRK